MTDEHTTSQMAAVIMALLAALEHGRIPPSAAVLQGFRLGTTRLTDEGVAIIAAYTDIADIQITIEATRD